MLIYYFLVPNGPYGHIYLLGHPMGCPISHTIYVTILGLTNLDFHSMFFDWVISIFLPISFYVTPLASMGLHYVPLCLYGPQFGPLLASIGLCGHQ